MVTGKTFEYAGEATVLREKRFDRTPGFKNIEAEAQKLEAQSHGDGSHPKRRGLSYNLEE